MIGAASVTAPLADLRRAPDGARDRQLLFGDAVEVLRRDGTWAEIRAEKDGYRGWVAAGSVGPAQRPTHRVCAAATHVYGAPDIKAPERMALSLGARVRVSGIAGGFAETPLGHVPARHLRPLDRPEDDPVTVAARLLNTPYLWGGNGHAGIDCSGLVQIACHACGIACPGDSGPQARALGETLAPDAPLLRGDLVFWNGHVAWVAGAATLLHANAHHMAVAFEPLAEAIARIDAQGDGPVTRRARLGPAPTARIEETDT